MSLAFFSARPRLRTHVRNSLISATCAVGVEVGIRVLVGGGVVVAIGVEGFGIKI